jgi:hypothetical protein
VADLARGRLGEAFFGEDAQGFVQQALARTRAAVVQGVVCIAPRRPIRIKRLIDFHGTIVMHINQVFERRRPL